MYSIRKYEELLHQCLEAGYYFQPFIKPDLEKKKSLFLRHDIDYSPQIAVEFAKINHEAGVFGTFFFLLRSPIYNLLAENSLNCVHQIQALGQKIGLHFLVPPGLGKDLDSLKQKIEMDFETAKQNIPDLQPVFSWHNPGNNPGLIERCMKFVIPGLTNAYSQFFFKEVAYFSDSDIRYSVEEFKAIIKSGHPKLQLLFHPFEWVCGGENMIQVIAKTWPVIIREREAGVLQNNVYKERFPNGMPSEFIDHFARALAQTGIQHDKY